MKSDYSQINILHQVPFSEVVWSSVLALTSCLCNGRLSLDTMAVDSDCERDDDEDTLNCSFLSTKHSAHPEGEEGDEGDEGDELDGPILKLLRPRTKVISTVEPKYQR